MQMRCAPFAICLALFVCGAATGAQGDPKLVVSLNPLSGEQLAVYRAVLADWMDKDTIAVNLADHTVPLGANGPSDDESCGKGLDLEPSSPTLVHQFRLADLAQLGSDKIRLVDPKRGEKDVKDNDPGTAMRQGRSVEDAVRNGFAHGLFTFREIRFDKSHTHAMVSYSFVCGGLCGNGATVILEKTEGGWRQVNRCSDWISHVAPAFDCTAVARPA